jgi:hypothetical protein
VTGYAKYLDVDAAIDHHLLNTWPFNLDALRLSGYWYKQRGINAKMQPAGVGLRSVNGFDDGRDDNPMCGDQRCRTTEPISSTTLVESALFRYRFLPEVY